MAFLIGHLRPTWSSQLQFIVWAQIWRNTISYWAGNNTSWDGVSEFHQLIRYSSPFRLPLISWNSDSMEFSGITGSFNVNSLNGTVNNFHQIVHTITGDDKVLDWLSSLEPQKRHQHLRESRLGGVGQWIFQASEFQRWNTEEDGSAHSVLFCHGDPGVGKTHLR